MTPLLHMFLFGLLDSALEPFAYGCAAFLVTFRFAKSLPSRLASIGGGILAFLWMDDIWPRMAFEGGRIGMAVGDSAVGRYLPRGRDLGSATFHTGDSTGLFGVAGLGLWDLGSALVFVPLGFIVGLIATGQLRISRIGPSQSKPVGDRPASSTHPSPAVADSPHNPSAVTPGGKVRIHVVTRGGTQEAHTLEEVNVLLQQGVFDGDELAWRPGLPEWASLSQLAGVRLPAPPPLPGGTLEPSPPPLPASRLTPLSYEPTAVSPPASIPPLLTSPSQTATDGLRGIGGWLRFFTISIGVLSPLLSLGQMVRGWDEVSPHFAAFPALRDYLIVGLVGSGAVAVAGIVFSILLEKAPPNGRTLASTYLAIRFLGFILICLAQYAAAQQLPQQMLNLLSSELFGVFLRECLFLIVWGLYFHRSRRVRNTFLPRIPTSASAPERGALGL